MTDKEVVNIESMLTTIDNPYDPFTQFEQWFAFDVGKGYNTCGYLDRIIRTSENLSSFDRDLAMTEAMTTIIQENLFGVHKIVTKEKVAD